MEGESVSYLKDDEFLKIYGESPVTILNQVLNEYDCNGYSFRQSMLYVNLGTDINNQSINISLFNTKNNYSTQLDALSSGEKTLLALAFSIYKLKKNKIIAKLFLMDELDSALHPLMSKRLMDVLYNYFYKKLAIKIIISTHSPSTVAFSPESSLLVMRKEETPRLIKVNKDIALKELTIGVPSFSINYENRRQIFVESKYDVEYYEGLYNIFKNYLNSEISLNFIASGDVQKDKNGQPNSSCDVVEQVTTILRKAGNKTIYGIIDWDLKEKQPDLEFIKVLGFKSRYSIENFILDPLLIGVLLIREKIYSSEYFGLQSEITLQHLFKLDKNECQCIIDKVSSDIGDHIHQNDKILFQYSTIGNFVLETPEIIRNIQGHELEDIYRKTYPELKGIIRGSGDNKLKNTIISKVITDFINYTPVELLEILKSVQTI